jgi:argininosuccinate synthase
MHRIVLTYSGSLASSVAIRWLTEHYGAEVVAITVDLGQGHLLEEVRDRALVAGAVRAHVLEGREELARDYVLRALKANASCLDGDPFGSALGRFLIAKKAIEVAAIEQADAVAHDCVGRDQGDRWLELATRALNPSLAIIAPAAEWNMTADQLADYARARGFPVAAGESSCRTERNLWSRSVDAPAGQPWAEPPDDLFILTKAATDCPDQPAYVEITFERGVPTEINGVAMPLVELIVSLGTIAGAHGVGRLDVLEGGTTMEGSTGGPKVRVIHEAPAAVVLSSAHKELQRIVSTHDSNRFSRVVSGQYADAIQTGRWFTPLREALDAYVEKTQERVDGVIRLKLFKGDCHVVGRRTPHGPAAEPTAGSERTAAFDHAR